MFVVIRFDISMKLDPELIPNDVIGPDVRMLT